VLKVGQAIAFPESFDSEVGRDAILRPIANRPSPRQSFLPPETFPPETVYRFRGLPLRGRKAGDKNRSPAPRCAN
jgi:hypothetical protein